MHLDERRQVPGVAEIVGILAARQARAGRGLARNHARLWTATQPGADERERDAGEVAAATGATDDNVRVIARHLELHHGLLTDDGLVQQHVIEHATQRIFRIGMLRGDFYRFADRDAQAAGRARMFPEDAAPGICLGARARHALRSPTLHQSLAVRLLLEAHLDHVDAHVETKHRSRKGEG